LDGNVVRERTRRSYLDEIEQILEKGQVKSRVTELTPETDCDKKVGLTNCSSFW
jgi:hypothetical protein